MILDFAPGEAAQIDFGAGPLVFDASSRTLSKTWFFVMTLCFSRHQYVEFVRDQTVATWLKCHHHALRHFVGVPKRLIIDNPKCAITRAVVEPWLRRSTLAAPSNLLSASASPHSLTSKLLVTITGARS